MPAQPSCERIPGTPGPLNCWSGTFGLFAAVVILAIVRLFAPLGENSGWLDAALLLLATAATVAALTNHLPAPNVLLAAGIAAGMGGMAHAINDVTGFPFGRIEFTAALGPRLFGVLPLAIPALWAIAALNARGVARLLLFRSRQHPRHGYRVIGLAIILMAAFHLALNPFALTVKGWWTANPTPLVGLASWTVLSLAIQVAITPLLLDKFPTPRPPNFQPLYVWVALNGLLAAGLFTAGRFAEALLATAVGAIIAVLALRTGRGTVAHTACRT